MLEFTSQRRRLSLEALAKESAPRSAPDGRANRSLHGTARRLRRSLKSIARTWRERAETHYSYTTLGTRSSPNLQSHTQTIMKSMRDKSGELEDRGTLIVTQRQTDYSPAALRPSNRDGSIFSSRHTAAVSQMLLCSTHTHTEWKKENHCKPVATRLELRNVAARAAVTRQGGTVCERNRRRGSQRSRQSDWSIRANNYNNKTVRMQSSPQSCRVPTLSRSDGTGALLNSHLLTLWLSDYSFPLSFLFKVILPPELRRYWMTLTTLKIVWKKCVWCSARLH